MYIARVIIQIQGQLKCLALIAQVVPALGMNLKIGGLSAPQAETFSVSKSLTLSQEYLELKINAVAQLTFQMLTLLKKYLY